MKKFHADKTIESYNRIANNFRQTKGGRTRWQKELGILARLMPGSKILDIGCGPGIETDAMAKRGFDSLGIDASKSMIARAKKEFPKRRFRTMDFYQLKFPKAHFDGFMAIASLLHVPKQKLPAVLKKIGYVLVPNAAGLIAVKHSQSAWQACGQADLCRRDLWRACA